MSGFGSKQSFYNTFEAVVGEKPASFRQKVQSEQLFQN
jgi:methylphosphotriester-DNA--protein-cysteine methyltransferase